MPPYELHPAATPIEWWINKGETYYIDVPVYDDDDELVDVTGYTAKAQVRRSEREPVLHEWSAANSNISIVGGKVRVHLIAAQTSAWGWRDALVSIETYAPVTGSPRVIAQGPIHALPEITQ